MIKDGNPNEYQNIVSVYSECMQEEPEGKVFRVYDKPSIPIFIKVIEFSKQKKNYVQSFERKFYY